MNEIRQSILSTLAFYDLFDFPLTNAEIYDNLWRFQCEPVECEKAMEELKKENRISFEEGFYFLSGREKLVKVRQKRYLNTFKKWQIVKKIGWVWQMMPFAKMIGVVNTLAYSNAKQGGDIDLLIITKKNRIFTTRIFMTFWLLLLNRWRYRQWTVANKFCLSFFVTDNYVNMKKLLINDDDIYLVYWTKWLKSIYCTDMKVAERYWRQNQWIKDFVPNTTFMNTVGEIRRPNVFGALSEWFLDGWLGDIVEGLLEKSMLAKIKRNTPRDKKDGVMANKRILKFHPEGKRMEYAGKWGEKVAKF
ncbi:hypothetical protein KJ855_03565 [Patescibacteria group bacterium]|nr:hypothetical protein [Patescibacteria group bacterium]